MPNTTRLSEPPKRLSVVTAVTGNQVAAVTAESVASVQAALPGLVEWVVVGADAPSVPPSALTGAVVRVAAAGAPADLLAAGVAAASGDRVLFLSEGSVLDTIAAPDAYAMSRMVDGAWLLAGVPHEGCAPPLGPGWANGPVSEREAAEALQAGAGQPPVQAESAVVAPEVAADPAVLAAVTARDPGALLAAVVAWGPGWWTTDRFVFPAPAAA